MEYSIKEYLNLNIWHATQEQYVEDFVHKLEHNDYKYVTYWCQDEFEFWRPVHETRWERIVDILRKRNITMQVLPGIIKYYHDMNTVPGNDIIKLDKWGNYWCSRTLVETLINKPDKRYRENKVITNPEKIDYKYKFISMIKRPRDYRCEIMDLMCKENLFEGNAVSWFYDDFYTNYTFKYWKPQIMQLDKEFLQTSDQMCVPEEYYKSFAQLVTEADVDKSVCISEKTVIPLLFGKPFIVAAPAGFHETLKEIGFELYDEIFNYDFDKVHDKGKRWIMLIENFVNLQKEPMHNLKLLAEKVKDKILHNQQVMKNFATNMDIIPEMAKHCYNLYKSTGQVLDYNALNFTKEVIEFKKTEKFRTFPY